MGGMSTSYSDSYDWSSAPSVTRKSARDYAKQDDRVFTGATEGGIKAPVSKDITTDSPLAMVMVVDVTGSMKDWPELIFQKIPTLYHECNAAMQGISPDQMQGKKKTIDELLEVAVIAIDDSKTGTEYPIQVVDFCKGSQLVKGVNKILPVGGGGGNLKESYDLALYMLAKHCKMPNVPAGVKPVLVIAGDEGFYDTVRGEERKKYFGDSGPSLDTKDVMKEVTKKFDTYVLRPELSYEADDYARVHKQWQGVVGAEKVMRMENPGRLVDCIIGISGYSSDNYQTAVDLLKRRQRPDQVKEVIETLHGLTPKGK